RAVAARTPLPPMAPLTVVPLPAGTVETEALGVTVEIVGFPLPQRYEASAYEGIAKFPAVPTLERPLRIGFPTLGIAVDFAPDQRRRLAGAHVLAFPASEGRHVRLRWSGGAGAADVVEVIARPDGGTAYGLVPFTSVEGGLDVLLPPGQVHVLVDAGKRWGRLDVGADPPAGGLDVDLEDGFVLQGRVSGRIEDSAVVRLHLEEGEKAYSGQGFVLRVLPQGSFEARLPLGRWRLEVQTRSGIRPRKRPLDVTEPGQVYVPLDAP
ncbi:MAG: hypothetical protein ACC662_09875, partial [Planctomycetota bacterium]